MMKLAKESIEWVQRNTEHKFLEEPAQELITILVAGLRTGPWNIHKTWNPLKQWPYGASMHITQDLATNDMGALTRLVFAAHDRGCRVSVGPSNFNGVRVSCWTHADRHPTLDAAVAAWKKGL